MQVAVDQELKKKAVKTHPIENIEAEDKTPHCYFSEEHEINEELAKLTELMFGHSICSKCLAKITAIVSYAGTRDVT